MAVLHPEFLRTTIFVSVDCIQSSSTHVTVASKLFGFRIKCPKEEI